MHRLQLDHDLRGVDCSRVEPAPDEWDRSDNARSKSNRAQPRSKWPADFASCARSHDKTGCVVQRSSARLRCVSPPPRLELMAFVRKLHHTRYRLNDLEKSVQFYKEILGLEEVRR